MAERTRNSCREEVDAALKSLHLWLIHPELRVFLKAGRWHVETTSPVVAKMHKSGKATIDPPYGVFANPVGDKKLVIEYEPDPNFGHNGQVPLQKKVEAFLRHEVQPYTSDARIDAIASRIGYEISFNRHFDKPQPLRSLDENRRDFPAVEEEAEGLLDGIFGGAKSSEAFLW